MTLLNKVANTINKALAPFDVKLSRVSTESNQIGESFPTPNLTVEKDQPVKVEIQIREVETQFVPDTWVMTETPSRGNLWVDLSDLGVSRGCLNGNYEVLETKFVEHCLKAGDTFLDIGANIGWFTISAASIVGAEGMVYAFEPRNTTFKYLEKTVSSNSLNQYVQVFHCALGAKKDTLRIVWGTGTSNPGGTWLVSRKEVSDFLSTDTHTYQDIKVEKLDEFTQIKNVNLIKIDVEGAEPLVLLGAERILRDCRPIVLSELNEELLAMVGNSSSKELITWMQSLGYECYELTDQGIGKCISENTTQIDSLPSIVNVLFVPRGYDKDRLSY